jgi:hypothetical protein
VRTLPTDHLDPVDDSPLAAAVARVARTAACETSDATTRHPGRASSTASTPVPQPASTASPVPAGRWRASRAVPASSRPDANAAPEDTRSSPRAVSRVRRGHVGSRSIGPEACRTLHFQRPSDARTWVNDLAITGFMVGVRCLSRPPATMRTLAGQARARISHTSETASSDRGNRHSTVSTSPSADVGSSRSSTSTPGGSAASSRRSSQWASTRAPESSAARASSPPASSITRTVAPRTPASASISRVTGSGPAVGSGAPAVT